ncbi:MAG: S8 family serine peptidase [Burkholderiaceae bacterium]
MQAYRRLALGSLSTLTTILIAACGGTTSVDDTNNGGQLNESTCSYQYTATTAGTAVGIDPLLSMQWHILNTGQFGGIPGEDVRVDGAWGITRGENVRVAVVDDSLEVTHEDLVPNVVPGGSYNYRPARRGNAFPLPCELSDDHGTAVGGIIAARDDNALGGSGVAPKSDLVGFNALSTATDADIADALGRDINIIGVYNNSWGARDDGVLNPSGNVFEQAILDGIETGRAGKGAIYVFPAGNGGCLQPNCDRENSNYDGYVNKLGVITACAFDNRGKQPVYGERGANILLCGPSSTSNFVATITTTGLENTYRSDFNGTSASTPMVSGVIALMLSANPDLTWRDVQQILAKTARKNDPTDPEWSFNFGLNHNPKFGFGAVDAASAVSAVTDPAWTSVGGSSSQISCGPYNSSPNAALTDAVASNPSPVITPFNDSVPISGCAISNIEFVEIRLTVNHSAGGSLRVVLTSPNGLVSTLATERTCVGPTSVDNCGTYDDWQFGSVRHMDEPVSGNWTLTVADAKPGVTGVFQDWSIKFYGR